MDIRDHDNLKDAIAKILRQSRKDRGLTQKQVAKLAGVRIASVGQGEVYGMINAPQMAKLCIFYGIKENYPERIKSYRPFLRRWRRYMDKNHLNYSNYDNRLIYKEE